MTELVVDSPIGKLKQLGVMPSSYHREDVESHWDKWWQEQGLYTASAEKAVDQSDDEKFIMVIPPPNVTGSLHIGHALMCSIEDALARWNRMKGKTVLWVPGVDHSGIATQVVVEKMLWKKESLTRHDLGREAFVAKIWEWKEQYGSKICNQFRRLGCSLDWNREAFTMDENLTTAVIEAFVRMNESGRIYRENRLVNWSCHLRTAISNIEVETLDIKKPEFIRVPGHEKAVEFGVIHSFAYKVIGSDEEVVVATTRIETMLGDVAVAVHPEDERYKHIHGKKLKHPFNDRELQIVLDSELVKIELGTGAVKVTPAHDPNDFACGKRHNLEFINVFNDDGSMNENGYPFEGMMRYDARKRVIAELESLGLYRGKNSNPMVLGRCSRSKDIVEPFLKPQWWIDCGDMAKRSTEAVRKGDLKILPQYHEKTWFQWLDNIQDWCISRQLWWGHRIPAYRIIIDGKRHLDDSDMNYWSVARTEEIALRNALERFPGENVTLEQDEDVLDTWFSSGLFPFSTLKWPQNSKDYDAFYPNTILETGQDILFFWVARMVMMGLELTDKLPFKQVFLHPMVRDRYGRKLSKMLGNVVDPIAVIEGITLEELHETLMVGNLPDSEIEKAKKGQKKDYPSGIPECGADALRFALLDYLVQERNINLDVNRVHGYRQFCNKIWNAAKFCMTCFEALPSFDLYRRHSLQEMSFTDTWILSRLDYVIRECNEGFESFAFNRATHALYVFFIKEFCAVYLESVKPHVMLREEDDEHSLKRRELILYILLECLETFLKLMHPMMPFVTEDLYQRLPGRRSGESIMVAVYPQFIPGRINETVDHEMDIILEVLHMVHSSRDGFDIPKSLQPNIFIKCSTEEVRRIVEQGTDIVQSIAKLGSCTTLAIGGERPPGCVSTVVSKDITLFLHVQGQINCESQITKLQNRLEKTEQWIQSREKLISRPKYIQSTPADMQAQHKRELEERILTKNKIADSIAELTSIASQS